MSEKNQFINNFFGPVGKHIDYVETMVVIHGNNKEEEIAKGEKAETKDAEQQTEDTDLVSLPQELNNEVGLKLLNLAKEERWLDDKYMPTSLISRPEQALLANSIADIIRNEGIPFRNEWAPFEKLWQIKNLRQYYDRAMGQEKTNLFLDRLKQVLS